MMALLLAALFAGGPAPQQSASPSPPPSPEPSPSPSVQELYQKIVPPPAGETAGGQAVSAEAARAEEQGGLRFGFLRFRPSIRVSYIDADNVFLESAQPVHARYFQIEPDLGLGLGVSGEGPFGISFRLSYEPKFRASTHLAALRHPTHLATASLAMPLGAAMTLTASHHFAHGLMETTEVDPGREYFFQLGLFTHNISQATASFNAEGRLRFNATGSYEDLTVDDRAAFFDHRTEGVAAEARYAMGPDVDVVLRYGFQRVPRPPEHPEAESDSSTASAGLEGTIGPLLRLDTHVGFQDRHAPLAGPGGTRYRGTAGDLRLTKEFTPTSAVSLFGSRTTYASAFESNGFYLTDVGGVDGTGELALSLVLHAAAIIQRNTYRVPDRALGRRRHDDLFGWSVGLGRPLTRWGYLRVDYRRDRRRSNLDTFNTRGSSLIVQLGIGYLGRLGERR